MHVLRAIVFFLYFSLVVAHVPVFPPTTSSSDAFQLKDVTKKSYGVYGELAADDIVWLEIEGIKGEEMSVSLQRNEVEAVYDLAIWGEGLDNVTCGQKNWYGWTHALGGHYFTRNLTELPTEVKGAIGTSEAFVLHGDGKEAEHFEPFGVGVYWPLSGCKDTFPATATYRIALVNPAEKTAYFSVGVGMVESFSLVELLLMPFVIYRTFLWSGRTPEAVIGIFVVSLCLSYVFNLLLQNRASVVNYSLLGGNARSTTVTIATRPKPPGQTSLGTTLNATTATPLVTCSSTRAAAPGSKPAHKNSYYDPARHRRHHPAAAHVTVERELLRTQSTHATTALAAPNMTLL